MENLIIPASGCGIHSTIIDSKEPGTDAIDEYERGTFGEYFNEVEASGQILTYWD